MFSMILLSPFKTESLQLTLKIRADETVGTFGRSQRLLSCSRLGREKCKAKLSPYSSQPRSSA